MEEMMIPHMNTKYHQDLDLLIRERKKRHKKSFITMKIKRSKMHL